MSLTVNGENGSPFFNNVVILSNEFDDSDEAIVSLFGVTIILF